MYSNVVEDENDALNKILEELNRNNKKASKWRLKEFDSWN
jgi:hypothetical protein